METTPVIQLFFALGIIIVAAQFAGAAARAIGQPRVFGELLAGVLLGPTLFDLFNWSVFTDPEHLSGSIEEFAELGVLFLMFAVGLEVQLHELLAVGKVAIWGGVLGAVLPTVLIAPLVLLFDHPSDEAIFIGVTMAATSVSISAQTLLELGVLRTREGMGLLATAVMDDILAILMLSIAIATLASNGDSSSPAELVWILVRMVLYLGGALAVAWFVLPRLFQWIHDHRELSQRTAAFALIAALLFGWSADALGGVAAITGAFIVGVGLSQTSEKIKHDIEMAVRSISYSFLVPIFFVNVGLHVDLMDLDLGLLPLTVLMLIAAAVSKVIGCGAGALLGGFNRDEAFRLGVCMISRGEVGLIIASLGLSNGLISPELFQPVFLVVLLTTVVTPPLVRWVFQNHESRDNTGALSQETSGRV